MWLKFFLGCNRVFKKYITGDLECFGLRFLKFIKMFEKIATSKPNNI